MPVATMTCPECGKEECDCGYFEPCMNKSCGKKIDPTAIRCPHCNTNQTGFVEPEKPKKAEKPAKQGRKRKAAEDDDDGKAIGTVIFDPTAQFEGEDIPIAPAPRMPRDGRRSVSTIALGRMSVPDPNYRQLRWNGGEVTDESLIEWAEEFHRAYEDHFKEKVFFTPEAYRHYCGTSGDPVLRENARRLYHLLGGK